jgi:hypothetical protein
MGSKYNDEILDIFKNNIKDILLMIGFDNINIISFINLDKEIVINLNKEADFGIVVEKAGERFIIHFESQSFFNNKVPKRLFDYNTTYYLQTGLKVHTILFLLSHEGYKEENIVDYYIHNTFNEKGIIFKYEIIYGWKGIANIIKENKIVGLYPLLFLSEDPDFEEFFTYADKEVEKIEDENLKMKLQFASRVLGGLNKNIKKVRRRIKIMEVRDMLVFPEIEELKKQFKKEGEIKGEISLLEKLYAKGKLTDLEYMEMIEPLKKKLEELSKD